jgi:hypothetical protein
MSSDRGYGTHPATLFSGIQQLPAQYLHYTLSTLSGDRATGGGP